MQNFNTLSEVDRKVIKGIHAVVKERGENWRYPNGYTDGVFDPDFVHDPEWSTDEGSCFNLLRDNKTGACIIGSLAVDQGLFTMRESYSNTDAEIWGVSPPVREAMRAAQRKQDQGYSWGAALVVFNDVLAGYILYYKEMLPDVLSEDDLEDRNRELDMELW